MEISTSPTISSEIEKNHRLYLITKMEKEA